MSDKSVWEFYCHQNQVIPLAEIKGETSQSENISQRQELFTDVAAVSIKIGDISQNIITYNSRREDNLFELEKETLKDFKPPRFPTPQIDNLLGGNKRLLLLGGDHDDKKDLARYLAATLVERESQPETKVFILYDITHHHLNKSKSLSLRDIHEYAQKKNNYVIAVTDEPLPRWSLDDYEQQNYWYEPKAHNLNLYETSDLVESLFEKLNDDIKSELIESKLIIKEKIDVYKLQTFASILRCARDLNNLKKPILLDRVDEVLKDACDRKSSLEKWYNGLEEKDQLIALALTFFDGFLEDQFFEALYELVIKARSFRNKELESTDKTDLKNLANHFSFDEKKYSQKLNSFKFVKPKLETTEIEIRSIHIRSDERQIFFEIAWETYRRQILNALPVIVNLIKESAEEVPTNLALYGSPLHRSKLREVLAQTLSDLGLVTGAISAVQDALFQLATNQRFELQEVAAKVIEKWYSLEREKESLGTLQIFYGRAMDVGRGTQESREFQDNVIATISLAVTRVANYEPPGELSDELCDWLKELSTSQSPIVSNYLGYNTLYNLVLQHLGDKLSKTLKQITQLNHLLNDAIAASLARAYEEEEYTNKVWNTLKSWYIECANNWNNKEQTTNTTNTDSHQRLLRTVATAYGQIQFHKENDVLKVEKEDAFKIIKALRRLHIILVKEDEYFVCEPATIAIITLSNRYFEQIETELEVLGNKFSQDRRKQVVEVIKKVYQGKTQLTTQVDNIPHYLEFLLRTVGLSQKVNQNNKYLVDKTLENLFQILRQEANSFINQAIVIAIRLLAQNYFEQFVSQLQAIASQLSEEQRQEIINILIEIYLDQRSTQKGGDGEVDVQGCKYPTWTNSERPLTDVEKAMSDWLNNNKSETQQQIAIEASLEFIRALGTLDPASFSTGLIKDLEKYAPKCSIELRQKFVKILTEIYHDQRKRTQQSITDEETDIEKIIIYWLKNDNNSAIKEIAMQASVEFLDV